MGRCWLGVWLGLLSLWVRADPEADRLRDAALASWREGRRTNAVEQVSAALGADPGDARLWNLRAQMRSLLGMLDGAEQDLGRALDLEPGSAFLHQERGTLRFRAGRVPEAVMDFDRANELGESLRPQNWQRGIALYYVGRFADARRQFELHQTVNAADVENAAWHFLCRAREAGEGVEAARKGLMPFVGDSRVPMREIHALFSGTATPADVLAAARGGEPTAEALRGREFYAHLYIALHHAATGDTAAERRHAEEAARRADAGGYMGDVARVHLAHLTPKSPSPKP